MKRLWGSHAKKSSCPLVGARCCPIFAWVDVARYLHGYMLPDICMGIQDFWVGVGIEDALVSWVEE